MPDTLQLYITHFNDWSAGGDLHLFDLRFTASAEWDRVSVGASLLGFGLEVGAELIF